MSYQQSIPALKQIVSTLETVAVSLDKDCANDTDAEWTQTLTQMHGMFSQHLPEPASDAMLVALEETTPEAKARKYLTTLLEYYTSQLAMMEQTLKTAQSLGVNDITFC